MTEGIRGKWVFDPKEGKLVATRAETKPFSAPYVQQDTIDPTFHPATGQYFDSKSAFRRKTKELGYVEIDDNSAWERMGERKTPVPEGFKEDFAEVRHWYSEALKGNRDYINANVPPEWRDCEEENPEDITEGIRR